MKDEGCVGKEMSGASIQAHFSVSRFPVRLRWLALAIVAAVGLALRCQHLAKISFWFDESFTWKTISFPWSELLERVARDNQPPLYYALLKLWAGAWGDSPVALRSFSVLCGMLTVGAVYLFVAEAYRNVAPAFQPDARQARRKPDLHYGQRTALLAATLVALSPFQIQWSVQARMYALLTALVALSSWLMARAVHAMQARMRGAAASEGSARSPFPTEGARSLAAAWALFTLAAVAVGYTHYYGLFAVAAQFLFLLGWAAVRAARPNSRESGYPRFLCVLASAAGVGLAWS